MAKKPHEGTITKVWFDKDTKQTTVRFQTGSRHIDYFASQIKDRLKPVDSKDNRKSGGSESKISSAADAAKFLKENAEKYMDYQYDDEDMDDETRNNFKAASKYIKMGKTLTAGSKEAIDYEEKMSKRGYHVIDVTPGSGNQSTYALIKKNN
jgi:hypothetical protein